MSRKRKSRRDPRNTAGEGSSDALFSTRGLVIVVVALIAALMGSESAASVLGDPSHIAGSATSLGVGLSTFFVVAGLLDRLTGRDP